MNRPVAKRNAKGFTLIEILVVLAILGLLAGLVGPRVMNILTGSKSKAAKLQIEQLGQSLDLYQLDVGRYPTTSEGLEALVVQPSGVSNWNGPYPKKNTIPKDPWNFDYHYRSPGEHGEYDLYSLGSDNAEGGDGEATDQVSWN